MINANTGFGIQGAAAQNFNPKSYEPKAGPEKTKILAGTLAATTLGVGGLSLYNIITGLSIAAGVAGLVMSGVGLTVLVLGILAALYISIQSWREAKEDLEMNTKLQGKAIELTQVVDKSKAQLTVLQKQKREKEEQGYASWAAGGLYNTVANIGGWFFGGDSSDEGRARD